MNPTDNDAAGSADAPLARGCYLLGYDTNDAVSGYAGTLRVDTSHARPAASGDLYQRDFDIDAGLLAALPDAAAGIPIFARDRYRYYLRVVEVAATAAGFSLAFEALRFSAEALPVFDGSTTKWPAEGIFVARMSAATAPPGYPRPERYFEGEVVDAAGTPVGRLSMGWVSRYLRKAILEIDRVAASEAPLDNGDGVDWRSIFDAVGWDLTVRQSQSDVDEPADGTWSRVELAAGLGLRDVDLQALDAQWRYHLLAVRQLDVPNTDTGVMYDEVGEVQREGLAVASHWTIPTTPEWGLVQGRRFGTTAAYLRTAVHELGHAMGLDHNDRGAHFMRETTAIARESGPIPFPKSIAWTFSPLDEHRLRHWPDPVVRPGGLTTRSGKSAPIVAFE
jgi:hypothetical protein